MTGTTESSPDDQPASTDALLTQVSHRAMATDFVVMLAENCHDAVDPVLEALEMLDGIEADLTIYAPESEISRINRDAHQGPVKVNAATFRLLQKAVLWWEKTERAFDVTAGPLVEAWGFTARAGKKPTADEIQAARNACGSESLILDAGDQSVTFAKPGMSINLGAIGKGDAIDRLATSLKQLGVNDFLIHGGQSSVLAAGDQTPESGLGWAVGVAHPTKPNTRVAGIWLRDAALGTSGSGKQFFHHRGKRFGHVIDPRSGQPAGDLLSLTVITRSAADADACATGLFVAGSEVARRFRLTDDHDSAPQLPMLLIAAADRQDAIATEICGEFNWVRDGRPA